MPDYSNFIPSTPQAGGYSMEDANNQICRGWQKLVGDYKRLEHPTREQHAFTLERAKECMAALETVAMQNTEEYVGCTILYKNCVEIVDCVKRLEYHEKGEDGEWKKERLGPFEDLKLPGQGDSWQKKFENSNARIIEEFYNTHPDEAYALQQIRAQIEPLEAQLDDLKDEKRGKGFFNFDAKREVKQRMAPVKDEIKALRQQEDQIETAARRYASERLNDLPSYVRLSF